MPPSFLKIDNGTASNGVKMLLEEIRKHQPDMPPEVRDDVTFGALVVVYEMGLQRAARLAKLERFSAVYGALLAVIFFVIIALHAEVPWLTALLQRIFGTT